METSLQLADRFREVLLNGTWIANTNFKHQLMSLSFDDAYKTVGSHNSILTLTIHINYYIEGILGFFDSGRLEIHDRYSFDCQHIKTMEDWENLMERLFENAEAFAEYVSTLSDAQLDAVFVDPKYGTYRRNIEGVIEHSYYHLGQISLIKKLLH